MNLNIFDRRSAERFAELLDESDSGRHHARGQADEQLAELVAIGHSLSAAPSGVQVDAEFRQGLRAMLVATAERDGIGRAAAATEPPEPVQPVGRLLSGTGRRIRARGAIVIGVAAGAMAVSGISAASENAAPGDALYGVKRSTERAQLAMAGSDITRGQLSLTFARNRLTEAAAMAGDNRSFPGVLGDMDNDTRQGVKLLMSSVVTRRDRTPLASVDSFVESQRRVLNPRLDRLSPGNRERAQRSLELLESVRDRAGNLRSGLACDTVTQAGSDALGPRLRDCTTGAATGSTAEQPSGQGQQETSTGNRGKGDSGKKAKPKATASPTVDPTRSTKAVTPRDARPSPTGTSESPEPLMSENPDEDLTGESDRGLLGGLLGNVRGG